MYRHWQSLYETSVRPTVSLSHHSPAAGRCCGFAAERPAGTQQQRRSVANAGSATLTDDVGAEHRLILFYHTLAR